MIWLPIFLFWSLGERERGGTLNIHDFTLWYIFFGRIGVEGGGFSICQGEWGGGVETIKICSIISDRYMLDILTGRPRHIRAW